MLVASDSIPPWCFPRSSIPVLPFVLSLGVVWCSMVGPVRTARTKLRGMSYDVRVYNHRGHTAPSRHRPATEEAN